MTGVVIDEAGSAATTGPGSDSLKVLVTWEPSDAEWAVIDRAWPDEVRPVRLPSSATRPPRPEVDDIDDVDEVQAMVGAMRGPQLDVIRRARRLRLIHTLGHGVDALVAPDTLAILKEREILVARANAASSTIAEFTIMNMIALSRRLLKMHTMLALHGDWSSSTKAARASGVLGGELAGSVLGLIGYGNIGREIHQRAAAMGMTVGALVRDRRPRAAGLDFQQPAEEIEAFLARCDYVVLCLPLTPATTHLLDTARIASMRNGAYLLNVSRGPLVDEKALFDALQSGKLAGAALDVWSVEEQGGTPDTGYPSPYPLHQFNVIMTPHYAGATIECRDRAITNVGHNLRRLVDGEPLENVADFSRGF